MAPIFTRPTHPFVTIDRRALLGGAAATLASASFPGSVVAQRATPAPHQAAPASWLVVVPDARDTGAIFGSAIAVFASNGAETARMELPGIEIIGDAIGATGDPRKMLIRTQAGPRLLTLDPPGIVPVTGEALSPELEPEVVLGACGAAHPDWAVMSMFDSDNIAPEEPPQVVLVRLDRAEGVDIWPWIGSGDGADYFPSSPRFSASGAWLAIWDTPIFMSLSGTDPPTLIDTPAWLVPTADPAAARLLDGGHGRHNTSATVSSSDRFVAWTAFDPDDLLGAIVVEPIDGGDAVELARATMWSRAIWLPGDGDRLVTFGHGEVALHEIDAAGVPTSTTLARGEPIADEWCGISADGRRAIFGSRPEPDGPLVWQWLDLDRGEAVALPVLDGLRRERVSGVNTWPRWLMFGPDSLFGYDPLVGLDIETGETRQLIELLQWPEKVNTSADGRFAILGTDWEDTTPARLVDVATGAVTSLWAARTQMVRSGVVSPDGSRAAIHAVANADHALEVLLIDTADPAAMQSLSPGAAVLWTAEQG